MQMIVICGWNYLVKLEQITVPEASGKQTDVRDRQANTRTEIVQGVDSASSISNITQNLHTSFDVNFVNYY